MSLLSWFYTPQKDKPKFLGVRTISAEDFNRRYCTECKRHKALTVDEYESIPIAICKHCGTEFQPI